MKNFSKKFSVSSKNLVSVPKICFTLTSQEKFNLSLRENLKFMKL